ncbi:helix-turn-helix domain-containing protein [Thermomonospora cellulosilytica]|uniref:Transcriptional regulator with XRE-family HTH domain n=1 Tax=Thermomonospora cellulosilytica TaxID=1411118 RepID=A0A7W3N4U5_9ACTN|nr:helix-turn-helix transcriptional regulator [Thermomonospora cellulosilytica]MBA9007492.1 transcriptional regulator with XRE-family HTH domain [Thermomonospora cellulosilytica]
MDKRAELAEFLRTRRARLRPEDVGLRPFGGARRRVPGLRREELAQLAGVSVDYYVRLEQGRTQNVSEEVLAAVAQALRLDETEYTHLRNLARPVRRARRPAARAERVRPGLQRLLDMAEGVPAYVLGRRGDVLAWNRLAATVFVDFAALPPAERNWARLIFLNGEVQRLFVDWTVKARETVAFLRLQAGAHPDDRELAALVGELSVKSEDFRRWWADHNVKEKTHGRKAIRHPQAGELALDYESLRPIGEPDQVLVTYTAPAGSEAEAALRLLGSLAAAGGPLSEHADRA